MEPRLDAIAFFGGGTGGHIFPGIAVGERARERFPGCRAVFFRTSRSVEETVFEGRDLETRILSLGQPGRNPAGWLRYWREVRRAKQEILSVLRQGFQVAFGLGGYSSLPGILAAGKARIPVILLEQNRVAGRVNCLMAPFVAAVSCSYGDTRLRFPRRQEWTGNPVRREVLDAAVRRRTSGPPSRKHTVLVVGGSQGARGLNLALRDALPALGDFLERIHWIHVTGDADKMTMTEAYRIQGWGADVLAYSHDLPELMARSDIFLGRAGGTTLAELAVMGLPSVLVPYPYHRDQQQFLNARALEERGGARVIAETDLNAGSLRRVFEEILLVPERLEAMGRSARSFARPDAADRILDLAVGLSRRCQPVSESSF